MSRPSPTALPYRVSPPLVALEKAGLKWLLLLALLGGCAAPPVPVTPALPAAAPDGAWYRQARASGTQVYQLAPEQSLIAVTVRRAGSLARLGHDHLVASRNVQGYAAPSEGRADFHFRLDQMSVDEPGLRQEAGFDSQPSPEAIDGTRTNMLTRVLEADRYPLVLLHAERVGGNDTVLRLTITLHGITRTMEVPAAIATNGDTMVASGGFTLRQTHFGITPMSVLGGAIAVEDQLELRFRLVALPLR